MSSEELSSAPLRIDHTQNNTASGDAFGMSEGYINPDMPTLDQLHDMRRKKRVRDALGGVAAAYKELDKANKPAKPEQVSTVEAMKYLRSVGNGILLLRKWMLRHRGSQRAEDILDPDKNVGAVGSVNESTFDGDIDLNRWSQVMDKDAAKKDWTLAA